MIRHLQLESLELERLLTFKVKMVLPKRIELSTSPLPMECSTTELRQLGYGYTQHGEAVPCRCASGLSIPVSFAKSTYAQNI